MTAMTMTESRPRRMSGASSSRRRSGSVPRMPGRSTIMTATTMSATTMTSSTGRCTARETLAHSLRDMTSQAPPSMTVWRKRPGCERSDSGRRQSR